MPSKYTISDHQAPHFITFATVQWVDALSRPSYKDIIVESLRYCQNEKGLILYAWCVMSNHIHLIVAAQEGCNLSDILRDFKKFTSKKILKEIDENLQESRKNWMLWLFRSAGEKNSNNVKYQFWPQDNWPIELSTNAVKDQRLDYLHRNPVTEGLVCQAEYSPYSRAMDYAGSKGLLNVAFL